MMSRLSECLPLIFLDILSPKRWVRIAQFQSWMDRNRHLFRSSPLSLECNYTHHSAPLGRSPVGCRCRTTNADDDDCLYYFPNARKERKRSEFKGNSHLDLALRANNCIMFRFLCGSATFRRITESIPPSSHAATHSLTYTLSHSLRYCKPF